MSNKLPNIHTSFAEWYQEVVYKAELADQAPVRGCMVVRPYGWALWERMAAILDARFKATGHENAAFPLLIPMSFLQKEAKHVEGFAPELAVVTQGGGKELEEPLAVRPTSETIIHYMFAQWLRSWRDLPIKINQWGSVIRWEMRTRPFLRTTEFFWQEGHTAHETEQEADEEARLMHDEYTNFIRNYLAIPVVKGEKSASERFAGADVTLTMEALMPDGKALQMGTSHRISQNFAKSFNMTFQDREGKLAYPHLTSWAVSTRLIGGLVMVHGDEKGLVMPPWIAPIQVVIIPIIKKGTDTTAIMDAARTMHESLNKQDIRVKLDDRDYETPGSKFYGWELKGIPVRIELGPKDVEQGSAVVVDRLTGTKTSVKLENIVAHVQALLPKLHEQMLQRAQDNVQRMWHHAQKLDQFGPPLADNGGFYQVGWCNDSACEAKLKEHKATIRCLLQEKKQTTCFYCNKPSICDILVAKAY